jgi:erythronate-4-phosphate dehydrogenase
MIMLQILADENMPYVEQLFGDLGHVRTMAGRDITPTDLVGVDILLVRSITKVNRALLAQADRLKLVGSATIGTDHLDTDYLELCNIQWRNAPGCNATAVAEYVISALMTLAKRHQITLQQKVVAIVGAGNIGQRLAKKLAALDIDYFFCDPPLARSGVKGDFRDMAAVAKADIISLHVPMINNGVDKTVGLIDQEFLAQLKPDTILINSCRGDVVNNQHLLDCLNQGQKLRVVMDVWQNEPTICQELMANIDIATPHIAGYSLEGKARGTFMLYQQWCQLTEQAETKTFEQLLPSPAFNKLTFDLNAHHDGLSKLVRMVYDIRDDDELCRARGNTAQGFDNLRKQYDVRREFSALIVVSDEQKQQTILNQLGFTGE